MKDLTTPMSSVGFTADGWSRVPAYQKLVKEKGEEKTLSGLGLNPEQVFFLSFAQAQCVNYKQSILVNHYYKTGKSPAARFR
ncbi:neprilysin [Elysia marginata]|uniref:Neprilysin n=1 Tax=Elysia marginata TaxID=1093978 RepID=A0AAV4EKI5_9GAST|nr:neprilysin [Elysia marginata]